VLLQLFGRPHHGLQPFLNFQKMFIHVAWLWISTLYCSTQESLLTQMQSSPDFKTTNFVFLQAIYFKFERVVNLLSFIVELFPYQLMINLMVRTSINYNTIATCKFGLYKLLFAVQP
jgi:hypothetical protein